MEAGPLVEAALAACPQLRRPAWTPTLQEAEQEQGAEQGAGQGADPLATRFGGNTPFRPDNFRWPICEECHAHKAFVCQINLSELPGPVQERLGRRAGLFQLFYCLECMPLYCTQDIAVLPPAHLVPSLKSQAARVAARRKSFTKTDLAGLPPPLRSYVEDYTEAVPLQEVFGERLEETIVTGWQQTQVPEVPMVCELWSRFAAEIRGRAQLSEAQVAAVCSALEDWADPRVAVTPPGPGVKLGGWVRWCQGVEYPHCSRCGLAMDTPFLQLEEDPVYSFMWGDCGTGHVTLCPGCGRAGLQWACS